MHRIDVPSATADHQFTEGSVAGGVPATTVSAAWLNDMQEELISILAAASIAPVKGDQDQVLAAILALIAAQAGGMRSLTPNGFRQIGDIVLQWGFGTTATGNLDDVVFPVTFPDEVWAVIVMESAAAGWGPTVQPTVYGCANKIPSGFKVSGARVLAGGGALYESGLFYNYIAVGR
ncbi:gp53-like domain-containing protein [Azotobacter chroococcum]|uniref:Putative tail fiber protein gp53-like C-terminal domain-containing protein n=1 Tax=Azotobacter chroococcum TaxID=353 RepID=A0AAQ0BXA4_9GAMM|nr:hypothetical protein [Azotobacter chroococcum]QQE86909.1 hypothetical protein GKQ51_11210 [Azotobacter chroococcum]TKD40595.1 hypothetical protein FCG41_09690 [Azotobacter chroococcum]